MKKPTESAIAGRMRRHGMTREEAIKYTPMTKEQIGRKAGRASRGTKHPWRSNCQK